MPEFLPALAVADLPPGRAAEVTVGGQAVALFNVGGTFHALPGRCPHRGGPLGQGFLDGSAGELPVAQLDLRRHHRLQRRERRADGARLEVRVEDGQVYVRLG